LVQFHSFIFWTPQKEGIAKDSFLPSLHLYNLLHKHIPFSPFLLFSISPCIASPYFCTVTSTFSCLHFIPLNIFSSTLLLLSHILTLSFSHLLQNLLIIMCWRDFKGNLAKWHLTLKEEGEQNQFRMALANDTSVNAFEIIFSLKFQFLWTKHFSWVKEKECL